MKRISAFIIIAITVAWGVNCFAQDQEPVESTGVISSPEIDAISREMQAALNTTVSSAPAPDPGVITEIVRIPEPAPAGTVDEAVIVHTDIVPAAAKATNTTLIIGDAKNAVFSVNPDAETPRDTVATTAQ
jgi:hypothetical protein